MTAPGNYIATGASPDPDDDDWVRRFCKLNQRLCQLADEFQSLGDQLQDRGLLAPDLLKRARPWLPAVQTERDALREVANAGTTVEISLGPDGSATVVLGTFPKFRIAAPGLAELMFALCDESGPWENGLVGWKSLPDVAALIRKKTGREPSVRSLRVRLCRLRGLLRGVKGLYEFYVQTDPRSGAVRFARRVGRPPESGVSLR